MDAAAELLATRIDQLSKELAECRHQNQELEARLSEGRHREAVLRETVKELQNLYAALAGNSESERDSEVTHSPKKRKASQAVRDLLSEHNEGLTVGDCVRLLEGRIHSRAANKRNTISTTLYNMKKRGEVVYDPGTGRYSYAPAEGATEGD